MQLLTPVRPKTNVGQLKRRPLVTGLVDVRHAREAGDKENADRNAQAQQRCQSCPICLDTVCDEVRLCCGHGGCRTCAMRYISAKIECGEVFERQLGCPFNETCRRALSLDLVRQLTPPQLFRKLLALRKARWTPEPESGQVLLYCTSPGCEPMVIQPGEDRRCVSCPCGLDFCDHCANPWHDEGICPPRRGDMEAWLKVLARKHGWQCCPVCGALVEKRGGCNFMTCPSSRCNSLVHFCYLCGQEIGLQDHNSLRHFYDGPFGNRCSGQRRSTRSFLPPLSLSPTRSHACAIQ